jgi:endonuclease G, mitochondrial
MGPLERAIRRLVDFPDIKAVHVATGPLYERNMPKLPHANEPHIIPSGYWKVVAIGAPNGLEAVGFVMDQKLERGAGYCAAEQRIAIPALERRAGLRFFPNLERHVFTTPAANARPLARRLGCGNQAGFSIK